MSGTFYLSRDRRGNVVKRTPVGRSTLVRLTDNQIGQLSAGRVWRAWDVSDFEGDLP